MADEEDEIPEEEEGGGGGGNKLLLIISLVNVIGLLGIAAYVVLGGGGSSGPQMTPEEMAKMSAEGASPEKKMAGIGDEPGPMFELGTMVVNLREPGGDRFLKCKIQLELDAPETQAEVEQRASQIKYQLNALLSGHRVADVQGPENMESLRKKMQRRANTVMSKGKIVAIWPDEWIVQ